ncbi:MAG TPA: hypothetical protein VF932_11045 [Anaerolineae bacterium]
MLKPGQMIENPVSGARLLVCETGRETGGKRAVVEHFIAPHSGKDAIAHWHTIAAERFEILRGAGRYQLAKLEQPVAAGDVLDFPPKISHLHPWNTADEELHVRQTINLIEPNPRYLTVHEAFFETLFGLARDGKLDRNGTPNLLQLAVMARSLHPYTYLSGLPVPGQHLWFGTLALVGRRVGYRAQYPEYDEGEK